MSDNFREVYSEGTLKIKLYTPSIVRLFGGKLRRLSFRQKIRFYINLIFGYRVYHLYEKNNEIGYCVVANGGSNRYPFASKDDIIVGPYFISEEYRGRKLSIYLVRICVSELENDYIAAYDFIRKDNIASIKTTEACDIEYFSDANYTKFLRILKPVNNHNGEFLIYRHSHNND